MSDYPAPLFVFSRQKKYLFSFQIEKTFKKNIRENRESNLSFGGIFYTISTTKKKDDLMVDAKFEFILVIQYNIKRKSKLVAFPKKNTQLHA